MSWRIIPSEKGSVNLYKEIRDIHSADHFVFSAEDILHWIDTKHFVVIFDGLRKKLPVFLISLFTDRIEF